MIRHLLLMRFNAAISHQQLAIIQHGFESLEHSIEGVSGVEWGENNSPEGKNQGYTHSVIMNFRDETARQAYLDHPEHTKVKALFRPYLEDIIVFDYSPEGDVE